MANTHAMDRNGVDRWLVLITACLACFVVALNTTAVMTALPDIKAELDLGAVATQWVINVYMLGTAVLVAIMGRFSDIFGKLNVFLAGICLFAAGSFSIMAAEDVPLLMIGRVGQGIGAAALMAASVALVQVTTPQPNRPFAIGIWAGVLAFGLGAGPLVGGALTELVSWRAIFAVDALLLAISALLYLRIVKLGLVTPQRSQEEHVDYLGTALLIITLAAFVYALSSGQVVGWTSVEITALFAIAVVGAAAFIVRERRAVAPLVHFRFFRYRRYRAATIGIFVDGLAVIAALYFFNLYIQSPGGLNLLAYTAGAALLPFSATYFLLSVTLPQWLGKTSLRWPITAGMLCIAAGLLLLSGTTEQMTYAQLWWKLGLVGVGVGLTFPLLPIVGLRALPDEHAGQGSGVINMCFYMGISVGLAAGGAVLAKIRHSAVAATASTFPDPPAGVPGLVIDLAHGSASLVKQALAHFTSGEAAQLEHTLHTVGASAFSGVMSLFTIAALIGAATSFWLLRGEPSSSSEHS